MSQLSVQSQVEYNMSIASWQPLWQVVDWDVTPVIPQVVQAEVSAWAQSEVQSADTVPTARCTVTHTKVRLRRRERGWVAGVAGAVGARMRTDGRADGDGLLHHFGVCVLSLVLLWVGSGREWSGVVGSGHASSSQPATAALQG